MVENKAPNQESPKPVSGDPRPALRIVDGLLLVAHISGYIIGPLILIGGLGFWLDRALGGRKIIFIVSAILAFAASNFLVYHKAKDITKRFR